jgi:predicted nucleic acid-binding Zn ribbon protein
VSAEDDERRMSGSRNSTDGSDSAGGGGTEEDVMTAAALALSRARKAAADKGLRPGLRPLRRRRATGQPSGTSSGSGPDARDPMLLGEQLDRLLADRGWQVDVAVGSVIGRWPQIVGPQVADHVQPVSFEAGVLTLRAESTAWATQMRLLASVLLGRLEAEVGAGTVTEITVTGPSAPSWSKGRRRAPGRGPRDTYG